MSNKKPETAPAAGADSAVTGKHAQVRVLENRLIIGNFRHARNAIVDGVPFADAEFKEGKGKLEILNVK